MISIQKYKINEITFLLFILTAYYVFNKKENKSYYITSKFWLGISPEIVKKISIIQIIGYIGGLYWYINIKNNPPYNGILNYTIFNNKIYDILVFLFLIGYILWTLSLLQPKLIEKKTLTKSLFSTVPVFIIAIITILALIGTFEATNISPFTLFCIMLLNINTVLIDSIGWNYILLKQTFYIN
tara:strand:- start:11350 stop:11901 length:552 start_codon:yes stop_codon:yes gene_type:complete